MFPDTSVFSIKSWSSLRAFLYVVAPLVITATVTTHTTEWIGLATAVLAPALSTINTVNGFRKWFYGLLTAGQTVVVALNLLTPLQISPWLLVINAIIGGGVAAQNLHNPA